MIKRIWALSLVLILLAVPLTASAQTAFQAQITVPNTVDFPTITSRLNISDQTGQFVSGLGVGDILVYENNQEIQVNKLTEIEPGLQLVLAISPSPIFATRDSNAVTRYDSVATALANWASSQTDNRRDNLTFLTTGDEFDLLQVTDYGALQNAILAAPSDHRNATPNLQILSEAIDIAASTPGREGMGQAVFFITPHVEIDMIPAVQSLTGRAIQQGVRVYVWMVTSEAYFTNSGGLALQDMATATGGELFAFSGTQEIPDPELYFNLLRRAYTFAYESGIRESGIQELSVEINVNGEATRTAPANFELKVLPPNAILVSPPSQIYRTLTEETTQENPAYDLNAQPIDILIEFPDTYARDIVTSRLYINGEVVAENTQAPFDQFNWDLTGIIQSGEFAIQVEAVDALGLSSISLANTVDVTVQRVPAGFLPVLAQSRSAIISGAVIVALIVLMSVFIRMGRSRTKTETKVVSKDPVFQAVDTDAQPSPRYRIKRLTNRLQWPQRTNREPFAYLEKLTLANSLDTLTPSKPIPIHLTSTSFGTDINKVDLPLDELSMDAVHAHIQRNRDGHFYLKDNSSTGGSWINYQPTNGHPVKIEHGDLIHFGRIGFRFKLSKPPKVSAPVILPGDSR